MRAVPPLEMTKYELLVVLQAQGFVMRVVSQRKQKRRLRDGPGYTHGDEDKSWYMEGGKLLLAKVNVWYLRALASAETLHKSVPHLAPSDVYHQLLDPDYVPKPPPRKLHFQREGEHWAEAPPDPPRKRQRRARSMPVAVDEEDLAELHSGETGAEAASHHSGSDGEKQSSDSSSSGTSSDSESVSSSSSSDSSKPAAATDQPTAKPHAATANPPALATQGSAATDKDSSLRTRSTRSIPYGQCYLTPRFKDGVLKSYQMTCAAPRHQDPKCTKELSISVAGDEATCKSMLMAWILFGSTVNSRTHHMGECWRLITRMKKEDGLPPLSELEKQAPDDFVDYHEAQDITPSSLPPPRPHENVVPMLGPAVAGVPDQYICKWRRFAAHGVIPVTTTAQRQRAVFTAGSSYGVPAFLADARRYSYIHPNLPPPANYIWRVRGGGTWVLCARGG